MGVPTMVNDSTCPRFHLDPLSVRRSTRRSFDRGTYTFLHFGHCCPVSLASSACVRKWLPISPTYQCRNLDSAGIDDVLDLAFQFGHSILRHRVVLFELSSLSAFATCSSVEAQRQDRSRLTTALLRPGLTRWLVASPLLSLSLERPPPDLDQAEPHNDEELRK